MFQVEIYGRVRRAVRVEGRSQRAVAREFGLSRETVPFDLRSENPEGIRHLEEALTSLFVDGLDVVIDYLWGSSARTIIVAVAKAIEDAHPVRFVQVGEASRELVELPGAALPSSAIQLMGSGLKSVPMSKLLEGVHRTFDLAANGKLYLPTKIVPLSTVAENWDASGKPRLVFTLQ